MPHATMGVLVLLIPLSHWLSRAVRLSPPTRSSVLHSRMAIALYGTSSALFPSPPDSDHGGPLLSGTVAGLWSKSQFPLTRLWQIRLVGGCSSDSELSDYLHRKQQSRKQLTSYSSWCFHTCLFCVSDRRTSSRRKRRVFYTVVLSSCIGSRVEIGHVRILTSHAT